MTESLFSFENLDTSIINLDTSNFESCGDGTNWYIYASNNPLRFIDPLGLCSESTDEKPLIQLKLGTRVAVILGLEAEIGLVINPNNPLDSGILLSGGVGSGFELAVDTPLTTAVENIISVLSSTVDLTKPTKSTDLEGVEDKITVGIGPGGIKKSMDGGILGTPGEVTGIEVFNVGIGVYKTATTVVTAEEVIEGAANTLLAPFIWLNALKPVDIGEKNY